MMSPGQAVRLTVRLFGISRQFLYREAPTNRGRAVAECVDDYGRLIPLAASTVARAVLSSGMTKPRRLLQGCTVGPNGQPH